MQRRELEAKADAIENVLLEHLAPAKVTGGHVTPRVVQFLVAPQAGVKLTRIESLNREIAVALGVDQATITRQGNALRIDVLRRDPQPVPLLRFLARIPADRIPACAAALGLADDGAPLLVRLPAPDACHVLIVGGPGCGKTSLLHTVVLSLALHQPRRAVQFNLVGRGFQALAALPHLAQPPITESARVQSTLMALNALIDKRAIDHVTAPRIVLVIDDLDQLISGGRGQIVDNERAKWIGNLLQRGREAGVHVVAATAQAGADRIGVLAKANWPVRLVGRVATAGQARIAAGTGGSGAEQLRGTGDFVAVASDELLPFQAAYLPGPQIEATVQALRNGQPGREIIDAARPLPQRLDDVTRVLDAAVYALPGRETREHDLNAFIRLAPNVTSQIDDVVRRASDGGLT